MKRIRVGIIAGGWSSEREISLKSGKAVYEALDRRKYEPIFWDIKEDLELIFRERDRIDIAFPLLHGRIGEDGCIQGFLKILGIPFVGSDVTSCAISMNKKLTKQIFEANGLLVPRWISLKKGSPLSLKDLNFPLVVKPVSEGSSFGVSICRDEEELRKGIENAFRYDQEIIIEEYIAGKEITAPVIGYKELEVLPLIEIVPKRGHEFFDFEAKYKEGGADEICPARISKEMEEKVKETAKTAFNAIGCSIWARIDMIVRDEKIYLLEVNTIPGMTENSLFPLSAKKAGMGFSDLLDRLISLSLEVNGKR